ncbi:MAG: hypothetical protein HFG83_03915 [Dorea sp.]|nr:hypothetical protein [Dorea sp.]MCI9452964.1 hypothetical protein [Dorea sp.]
MSDRRLKEAFDNVHADDEIKRRTREFLARKTRSYGRGTMFPYRRLAAAMACLLLVAMGWGGYFLYFIPVSSISVDVNPSIELGINRFDRVVKVDTYNDDGYNIMSSLDVRFMDYRDAMDVILNQESEEAYLAEDSCIAIAVSGAAEGKQREMLACLHTCASSYGNVHCSTGSHGDAAAAHEAGMTLGRYQAFLELQALDSSITAEDIEGLTISQIWDKIAELSGDTGQDGNAAQYTPGGQNGCGMHHGNGGQDGASTQNGTQGTCQQNGHHSGHGHGH